MDRGFGPGHSLSVRPDTSANLVRVCIDGRWYDPAKAGPKAADNPMLEVVR